MCSSTRVKLVTRAGASPAPTRVKATRAGVAAERRNPAPTLLSCLLLLFMMAVDAGLLMPARVKTYAATTNAASCGTWNLVASPNRGGSVCLKG